MTDQPHVPMPDGYPQPDPPDDQVLNEHASWLVLSGRERTPATCFYCWHLQQREADRG